MKLIAATTNKGKIKEISEILSELDIFVKSQEDEGINVDVEETGMTFEENALIKARAVALLTDEAVIADDSGLCIDCLDGRPGVFSARYAGEDATDEDRINKVLDEMKTSENRTARFVCAVAMVFPDGREITAKGEAEGIILDKPQGNSGFGYDPIFYSPELKKTFAEADSEEKNKVSHRRKALENLSEQLKNM